MNFTKENKFDNISYNNKGLGLFLQRKLRS